MRPDWRGKFARGLLVCVLALGLLVLTPDVYFGIGHRQALAFLIIYAGFGALMYVRGTFHQRVAVSVLVLGASGVSAVLGGGAPASGTFFFIGLVTVATMLWSPRAGATATALTLALLATAAAISGVGRLQTSAGGSPVQSMAGWIGAALAVLLFGVAIVIGFGEIRRETTGAPVAFVSPSRAAPEAQTAPQVSAATQPDAWPRKALEALRRLNEFHDPAQPTSAAADILAKVFGYPYVALYLVDRTTGQAVLQSTSGPAAPRQDEEGGVGVTLSGESLVARAARTQEAQQAILNFPPPLEETRAVSDALAHQAAVPLVSKDRLLGVLLVHSGDPSAFGAEEMECLEIVTNQLAALSDIPNLGPSVGLAGEELGTPRDDEARLRGEALWQPGPTQHQVGDARSPEPNASMEIPLSLRDLEIGTISLAGDLEWSPEQRSIVEAVATQAALALDNARLVEMSQLSARNEHTLAEITSKVWASTTVDGVLRTALAELAQALDAAEGTIELASGETDDD